MKSDENLTGDLPFSGQWLVGNTPAAKIPSHGTNLFGVTYALDFMAVNKKGRTSHKISPKTIFGTENPKDFYSFGQPILSPVCGKIIKIHDDEIDQKVRRSLFAGIPYMLTQAQRLKERIENITGNYIVIQPKDSKLYICIVHIKKHSFIVREGETVLAGEQLAECGNSGNSTQPHIHIQAMDSMDFIHTKGIPLYFDQFFESNTQRKETTLRKKSFPNKHKVISTMSN